ncbi:17117_t:CDS:10 [Entrophospora sp. SA101]|nr:17117_t:CDS:10 [Entrophospora sp. SA101]
MVEYSTGLKVNGINDNQMKEVPVGEFKVLLSRINGQIYATGTKCTHYGAPLRTGVLASDGRLTCPWHAACFNVTTGDIEDAPGLDSLQKYKVNIKNDEIFVEADEIALKSGRKPPKCSLEAPPSNETTLLIIGGGAAGNAAAEKARNDGFTGKIIIVSRESYLPIDRPKLSKALGMNVEKIALRSKSFYDDLFISLKLGTSATALDPVSKIVTLDNNEKIKYDSLIIATGASPRAIPIPGINLQNIFYLRAFDDHKNIDNAIGKEEKKNLVVIGSSFIGMEVASIAAKRANVSVIGMEKVPFERVLGLEIGGALKKLHEKNGIKFYLETGVNSIEASDGTKIPADIVVVGAGVVPETGFLKGTPGITLERDGSIKVAENFKVEGLDDVYAVGIFPYHETGETIRIEHWTFAENTGRAAASEIVIKNQKPFKKLPYFWSAQHGKSFRYAGYASSFDDVIIDGSLDELKFAAYYARGEKILAVATIGKDPIASHSIELSPLDVPLIEKRGRSASPPEHTSPDPTIPLEHLDDDDAASRDSLSQ